MHCWLMQIGLCIHNHPSGNAKPGNADKKVTEAIVKAGKLIDIPIHVIIGSDGGYFSFTENSMISS